MTPTSVIESILFVHGAPLALKRIAAAARMSEDEARAGLADLRRQCLARGIVVVQKDDEYQLGSHPENAGYVEDMIKEEFSEDLSRASLETAAIIAYKGPVSRAEIDHVRGVNSSHALRTLLLRGLVDREERPGDSRTYAYRISGDFLKYLGLTAMEELPGYGELKDASAAATERASKEV
ncbi:MAG: SMC-Scp complex subunit ScpB [Patescibacteria group bacterium]